MSERCEHPQADNGQHWWAKYPVDPRSRRRLDAEDQMRYGARYELDEFCMRCGERKP